MTVRLKVEILQASDSKGGSYDAKSVWHHDEQVDLLMRFKRWVLSCKRCVETCKRCVVTC